MRESNEGQYWNTAMLFLTPPLPLFSFEAFSSSRNSPQHHYDSLYLMALTRNIVLFFKGNTEFQRNGQAKTKFRTLGCHVQTR